MRFAFVLVLLCACSHPVPMLSKVKVIPKVCFAGTTYVKGIERTAVGCFENDELCRKALKIAHDYGSIAGIVSLSTCARTP